MTQRHEIEGRLRSLRDISGIMNSMKNLSLMETRKLAGFLASQQRVVVSIQTAARDFLSAYPQFAAPPPAACQVYILIGADRGFCGDFNDKLLQAFDGHAKRQAPDHPRLIAVGSKLCNILENHPLLAEALDGPATGGEVNAVLLRLADTLSAVDRQSGPISVSVLHHDHENGAVQLSSVLPPFQELDLEKPFAFPPHLYVAAEVFYGRLIDHYLFAALHRMFFTSLMAEHSRRVQHLEAAINRLRDKTDMLGKKRNMLRQEEITEEIEVILLSSGATQFSPLDS
jgi:F-type H+-transporting ATPase subunit gamma